jgi:uncharacterized repeat protein (TIGR01451 family)
MLAVLASAGVAQARQEPAAVAGEPGTTVVAPAASVLAGPGILPDESAPNAAAAGVPDLTGVPLGRLAPTAPPVQAIPEGLQVVRFQGPPGVIVEALGPQVQPVATVAGEGLATYLMQLGIGYHVRLANLPDRPDAVLHGVVELVGHLHRPPYVDPLQYPIRIQLTPEDIDDVLDRGRFVTHVIYLEDQETAIPLRLPRNEIPVVSLSPAEDPLRVARALGRIVAVVRIGNRVPTVEEIAGGSPMLGGSVIGGPCPYLASDGNRCAMPCGPPCPPSPTTPRERAWFPRDEFLCDGGDHGEPASLGVGDSLGGINPRDAVVRFRDDRRMRLLPTNMVCVYAPRFAAVRLPVGPSEASRVETLRGNEQLLRQLTHQARQTPVRMTQNQSPELNRSRSRPSGLTGPVGPLVHTELRVLDGLDLVQHVAGHNKDIGPLVEQRRQKAQIRQVNQLPGGIVTPEGPVITGIVQGAGERVMAWKPQELASVEEPPNKPGIAVIKQVDRAEAQPGDVLTYTIVYRNMGNVPITSVSIVDSLLPRLEYVGTSAQGPAGAVFTATPNPVGATELRWDVGTLPPGASGAVSFQAKVR